MSELAEYARRIHEKENAPSYRACEPVQLDSKTEHINNVRAVICDVYGTIINYWKPQFDTASNRNVALFDSFRTLAQRFNFIDTLEKMNPTVAPQQTLSEFYEGLIALNHEKARREGNDFPEIRIESIWAIIIKMLKRNGYRPSFNLENDLELSRYVAFTYNFLSLGRELYAGVVGALEKIKEKNIVAGILSNAQFYTPIDLTLMIREQSKGKYDDYNELFDPDLTFYSYEYGYAKPSTLLFRKLYDALYEMQILPEQTVFIGNDLLLDVKPAQELGMKTALFTGDIKTTFLHDQRDIVVPDITFDCWDKLPEKVSFFEK